MEKIERRNTILDFIKKNQKISIAELRELFPNFSEMTLRRDLIFLDEKGYIKRTHGGATLSETPPPDGEFAYLPRTVEQIEAKQRIARHALDLIEKNRSIFLDAGTTTLEFAKTLPDIPLSAITNAPNIGLELMKRNNIEIILLGGSLNKTTVSTLGLPALNFLESLNIDIAFMATTGFSLEHGFTGPYLDECEIKRQVANMANTVIVLFDHTKVNKSLPFTYAGLDDVDIIITDQPFPQEMSDQIIEKGVKVIV